MQTVLTINQPYAGLILRGYKWTEIRTQRRTCVGDLYIHANKWTESEREFRQEFDSFGCEWELGILGKVTMLGSVTGPQLLAFKQGDTDGIPTIDIMRLDMLRNEQHRIWGQDADIWEDASFDAGTFNYLLADPVAFASPIPAKGKLGFWKHPIPDLPLTPLNPPNL